MGTLTGIIYWLKEKASLCIIKLQPYGLQHTRLLCPWAFFRQEYWSGSPCPSLGDLPKPGVEPASLTSPALADGSLPPAPPEKPQLSWKVAPIQIKKYLLGLLPQWSSGQDSMLSMQRTWTWSLVRKLRSSMLCGLAKEKEITVTSFPSESQTAFLLDMSSALFSYSVVCDSLPPHGLQHLDT